MEEEMISDKDRAGYTRNNLGGSTAFRSFVPTDLQKVRIRYTDELVRTLGEAHRALGLLAGRWESLPEDVRQKRLEEAAGKEAQASVRLSLDGTADAEAPAEEAPDAQKGLLLIDLQKLMRAAPSGESPLTGTAREDAEWLEDAILYAPERMKELPLSVRLVCELHDYVMHAAHNYDGKPGELRWSPVWIGRPCPAGGTCSPLNTAAFVPPVPEDMKKGLYRLEDYMHEEGGPDPLLRAALIHYQFEALHPFIDGNGRVGRLLTLLYLQDQGLLPVPVIPLSAVLKRREFSYYRMFQEVEEDGDYERMISFFLLALREACGEETARLAEYTA